MEDDVMDEEDDELNSILQPGSLSDEHSASPLSSVADDFPMSGSASPEINTRKRKRAVAPNKNQRVKNTPEMTESTRTLRRSSKQEPSPAKKTTKDEENKNAEIQVHESTDQEVVFEEKATEATPTAESILQPASSDEHSASPLSSVPDDFQISRSASPESKAKKRKQKQALEPNKKQRAPEITENTRTLRRSSKQEPLPAKKTTNDEEDEKTETQVQEAIETEVVIEEKPKSQEATPIVETIEVENLPMEEEESETHGKFVLLL
jgi:hypothetical protein